MINLLPPELSSNKTLAKISKSVRSITLIALVVFIVTGLGILGIFIVSSLEVRSLTSRKDSLTAEIKARETTEQKLVLLKDRVAKIKVVKAAETAGDEVVGVSKVLSFLGGNSSVSELAFDAQKADLTILFKNSSDLGSFLKSMSDALPFKSVVLTSFGFNPSTGYLVSLRLSQEVKK